MYILTVILGGILGIIVGSFLNVVALRMNTGKGIGGRSMCLSCNRTLSWYELIPLVSFFIQKGKCRKCYSKISWQYPLVELATGVLFAGVFLAITDPYKIIVWLFLVSTGMIIAIYDIRHRVIPVRPLIAFVVAGLFLHMYIVSAFLVALPFFLLWAISRGRWIGFGDVELMAATGLILSLARGYTAVMISFWIACLVILPIVCYFKIKKRAHNPEIPFGPFLLLGLYLVGITGFNIFSFITKMVQ